MCITQCNPIPPCPKSWRFAILQFPTSPMYVHVEPMPALQKSSVLGLCKIFFQPHCLYWSLKFTKKGFLGQDFICVVGITKDKPGPCSNNRQIPVCENLLTMYRVDFFKQSWAIMACFKKSLKRSLGQASNQNAWRKLKIAVFHEPV